MGCLGTVRATGMTAKLIRAQEAVCTDIPGTVALQHLANVEVRYGEPYTRRGGGPKLDTGSRPHQPDDKGVACLACLTA